MLRVGLTGELGSGKSTVAALLAGYGAHVLSSDEIGRALMQPGEAVYAQIVASFGSTVVLPSGQLDRRELSRLAFDPEHPRVEELNAIVHPAVLAEQERQLLQLAQAEPDALAVIESALLFTTRHGGEQPWRKRFDQIVLVTAPDEQKIQRFIARAQGLDQGTPMSPAALREEALRRLQAQRIPLELAQGCLVLPNDAGLEELTRRTEALYAQVKQQAAARPA